ncbi:glutathione S-transferase family protein [Teredinibacter turnerae]|uniref:glutathione S-transferase family protein n=1 Tax=Teredinibacter turnerae TaxID=2426 RepID=UPI001E54E947|nr:glutathione S-transferase [Teredinibacter turnerae]
MSNLKLYRHPISGHSHRAELMLSILGLDYELINVDLKNGEHKKPQFRKLNMLGQVPVLVDGERVIADSSAILVYLAKTYDKTGAWLPDDALELAEIQRFLSIASHQMVKGLVTARAIKLLGKDLDYTAAINESISLLNLLDEYLSGREWMVGEQHTIADIALYTYTKLAPEAGVKMDIYSNIRHWLGNVESINGFISMNAKK